MEEILIRPRHQDGQGLQIPWSDHGNDPDLALKIIMEREARVYR
jgi:hypothetical protein